MALFVTRELTSEANSLACAATSPKSRPWSLSQADRQTRPRAASISVAMSATMKATPWNVPIGRPNCSRVCAYGIEASSAPWAMPTASAPIEIRPPSRMRRNVLKPLPCSPSRFAAGIRAPSNSSSPGRRGMETELVLEPADREAGRVGRDDERADLGGAVIPCPGPRRDDVGAGLAGVGDEPLAAIEHPRAPVGAVLAAGGRPGPARIAAGARLGQPVRADDLALRHRDEEPLLLLVGAGQVERSAAEARVGCDDQAERAPHPADLLDGDRVGQRVEPGPALVLGDRDAEPAELADPPDDLGRESSSALVLVDDRGDLGQHEVADRVAQERVLRREIEVHRSSVAPGQRPSVTGATVAR